MNLIYKLLLTLSATSWMLIIYVIKEKVTICKIPSWLFYIILIFIPIILSFLSIGLTKFITRESDVNKCRECNLADGEFLPVYLGYFFVSLSVPDILTMCFVYLIVFVFTLLSQTQYFNPAFLIFGYHYYHITTEKGTTIFVIKKGKVVRNIANLSLRNLRRLNDTTFIERR